MFDVFTPYVPLSLEQQQGGEHSSWNCSNKSAPGQIQELFGRGGRAWSTDYSTESAHAQQNQRLAD